MTAYAPTITLDNATDASFRAWISVMSTALQTVGLTRMGDTGQIDKTTVTTTTSSNQSRGYEIFQMSRYSDNFNRADGILTAGSTTSTGQATYLATSGAATMPYIVTQQLQAAASPTAGSVATALLDPGTKTQSVDLDTISTANNLSNLGLWDFYLRYTDDNNYVLVEFQRSASNWIVIISQRVSGVTTNLTTSGSVGTSDPVHLRAEIDSNGVVKATFRVAPGGSQSSPVITSLTALNNNLLSGTKAGISVFSTSVADNLCVSEQQPCYLKWEYCSTSGTTVPGIAYTIGQSTDGAGTINSFLQLSREQYGTSVGQAATTIYFSGDGSYLNMLYPVSGATNSMVFCVERTRDASGAVTWDGITCWAAGKNTGNSTITDERYLIFYNQTATGGQVPPLLFPMLNAGGTGFTTAVDGADTYFFPRLVMLPKLVYDLSTMGAWVGDVTNLVSVSVSNCGATHTYLPYTAFSVSNTSNATFMLRYE